MIKALHPPTRIGGIPYTLPVMKMTRGNERERPPDVAEPRPRRFEPTLFKTVVLAVAIAFAIACAILICLIWLLGLSHKVGQSTTSIISLAQLSFGLVAGAGAAMGLVLAYRRHQIAEKAEARENHRLFNERFGAAATQLASDLPAVRLAGIYSLAGLADDWEAGRQQCIEVLCANARRGYAPEPEDEESQDFLARHLAWKDEQEFRHTLIRVIAQRLHDKAAISWQGHSFDLVGTVFDGGDFSGIEVQVDTLLNISRARFPTGNISFVDAKIRGGVVDFSGARLSGGKIDFSKMELADGNVKFDDVWLTDGSVIFEGARLIGGKLDFARAHLIGGKLEFTFTRFAQCQVYFLRTHFNGSSVSFYGAEFTDSSVHFRRASFGDGAISFASACFASGSVHFDRSRLSGSTIEFSKADFGETLVDFTGVNDWSEPPTFDFDAASTPRPNSVLLPSEARQAALAKASVESADPASGGS
jgi:uncharacterized protein YjbI with pentapeptide repeats